MIRPEQMAGLARNLGGQLADETKIRCAIGRGYYAVYHYCKDIADRFCAPLASGEEKNKGEHEKLFARLQGHSKQQDLDQNLRVLAEEAKKLRALRVTADYHLSDDVTPRELARGLSHLTRVEGLLKAFPQASDLNKR